MGEKLKERIGIKDRAEAMLIAKSVCRSGFKLGGVFDVVCHNSKGKVKWTERTHNVVTMQGKNHILDVHFHGETQVTTWYVGLKKTGNVVDGDELGSHSGWDEFTSYTGNRKEFIETAAAAASTSNTGNVAEFTMNGSGTVYGCFICSVASGNTGVLFSGTDFSLERVVETGDILRVTYTLSASDDGV